MAKPVVAEIEHYIGEIGYAKTILEKIVINNIDKIPNPSVGIEFYPGDVEKIRMSLRIPNPAIKWKETDLFWREIIRICDAKGIKVIPLVDDSASELVSKNMAAIREIWQKMKADRRITDTEIERRSRSRGMISGGIDPWLFWDKFTRREKDIITIPTSKMILEIDRQLRENISREKPTLSFVGSVHGDVLHDIAEVIPYPKERLHEAARRQRAFLKASRTAIDEVRKRERARRESMAKKSGRKKKKKPKRGGRRK